MSAECDSDISDKCRTCLKSQTKLQQLSDLVSIGCSTESYKNILSDIANILILDQCEERMPQGICRNCCRKLRSAQMFIEQAREANEKLLRLINYTKATFAINQVDCLQETPVDIEMKIELDQNWECDQLADSVVKLEEETISIAEKSDNLINSSDLNSTKNEIRLLNNTEITSVLSDNESFDKDSVKKLDEDIDNNDRNFLAMDASTARQNLRKISKRKASDDELLPVCCDQCNKVLDNAQQLARHKRETHLPDELKTPCPDCGRKFSKRCNMYSHMRTFHGPESVEKLLNKPTAQSNTEQVYYKCDKCSSKYANKYRLHAHLKKKHSNNSAETAATNMESDQVGNSLKDDNIVKKVKKVYNYGKRFLCTICGLAFHNQSALIVHIRRHTGEKPFKCDLCDKAYPRLYDLQTHRRLHTGEKPYKCTICEKAFRRSNKLTVHMRTHTNERPYKCDQCERCFKYSKDLNIHKRVHTGERPYRCDICLHTFTQSNSLKAHRQKHANFNAPDYSSTAKEFNLK